MTKQSASERQKKIAELLSDNGTMKAIDLAEYFHVSRETIRRDLIALSEAGLVEKWFGSAVPVSSLRLTSVNSRMSDGIENKMLICQKALEYIPQRSVLYLDTGSTAVCMARQLKNDSGYTVLTTSIPVINELIDSNNQLIVAGGNIDSNIRATGGMQTAAFLGKVKVDIALLGSEGFDRHEGPTTNGFDDAQMKQIVMQNAKTVIVLTEGKKASYSALTQYADWSEIQHIITDGSMDAAAVERLNQFTDVVVAASESHSGQTDR